MPRLDVVWVPDDKAGKGFPEGCKAVVVKGGELLDNGTVLGGEQLTSRHVYNPIGDGNCFFRCLSMLNMDNEFRHLSFRLKTMKYMIDHFGDYRLSDILRVSCLDQGITEEVILASARMLNANIYIYTREEGKWIKFERNPPHYTDNYEIFLASQQNPAGGHMYAIIDMGTHKYPLNMTHVVNKRNYLSQCNILSFRATTEQLKISQRIMIESIILVQLTFLECASLITLKEKIYPSFDEPWRYYTPFNMDEAFYLGIDEILYQRSLYFKTHTVDVLLNNELAINNLLDDYIRSHGYDKDGRCGLLKGLMLHI